MRIAPYMLLLVAAAGCQRDELNRKESDMAETTYTVTMKGNPLTVEGTRLQQGDKAPDATLVANDLSEVTLSSYRPKTVILSVVPSLDTGVCSRQTRAFNEAAADLGENVQVVTVSMDLPFAQQRWCGAEGIERVDTLSAHRNEDFGRAYGVLIADLRLLARSVFVIDAEGTITYAQYVGELTEEPAYDPALEAAREAAG